MLLITRQLFFGKQTSETLSDEFCKYIDFIIEDKANSCQVLSKAHNFENGVILDNRIIEFQNR